MLVDRNALRVAATRYNVISKPPVDLKAILKAIAKDSKVKSTGIFSRKVDELLSLARGCNKSEYDHRGRVDDLKRFFVNTSVFLDDPSEPGFVFDEVRGQNILECCENGRMPSATKSFQDRIPEIRQELVARHSAKTNELLEDRPEMIDEIEAELKARAIETVLLPPVVVKPAVIVELPIPVVAEVPAERLQTRYIVRVPDRINAEFLLSVARSECHVGAHKVMNKYLRHALMNIGFLTRTGQAQATRWFIDESVARECLFETHLGFGLQYVVPSTPKDANPGDWLRSLEALAQKEDPKPEVPVAAMIPPTKPRFEMELVPVVNPPVKPVSDRTLSELSDEELAAHLETVVEKYLKLEAELDAARKDVQAVEHERNDRVQAKKDRKRAEIEALRAEMAALEAELSAL